MDMFSGASQAQYLCKSVRNSVVSSDFYLRALMALMPIVLFLSKSSMFLCVIGFHDSQSTASFSIGRIVYSSNFYSAFKPFLIAAFWRYRERFQTIRWLYRTCTISVDASIQRTYLINQSCCLILRLLMIQTSLSFSLRCTNTHKLTPTHTHTHTHIYIYIYIN